MGWKLAGFNVLGGVEIDPEMTYLYRWNLRPRPEFSFKMGIQDFNSLPDSALADRLMDLDVLDGSPPCSSFSMAGNREKDWGQQKKFREGQRHQRLDDLFFHFIQTAARLKPKVVIAENVKGLVLGRARGYVKEIFEAFDRAGYSTQLFQMNSSRMGVPQRRVRTFFVCRRKDLNLPEPVFHFNETEIAVGDAIAGCSVDGKRLPPSLMSDYLRLKRGDKARYFSVSVADPTRPCPTVTSKLTIAAGSVMHWDGRKFSRSEAIRIHTFPDDYDFRYADPGYVIGMSVPPFMMQRVALAIAELLGER